MHVYAYTHNNPVNLVDPDGRFPGPYEHKFDTSSGNHPTPENLQKVKSGLVSFESTKIDKGAGINDITTTIKTTSGDVTVNYEINNGAIAFDFSQNDYAGILLKDGSKALANSMYEIAKEIDPENLSGRTVKGIDREMKAHWATYEVLSLAGSSIDNNRVGHVRESARIANIGGTDISKPGPDDNAKYFEF